MTGCPIQQIGFDTKKMIGINIFFASGQPKVSEVIDLQEMDEFADQWRRITRPKPAAQKSLEFRLASALQNFKPFLSGQVPSTKAQNTKQLNAEKLRSMCSDLAEALSRSRSVQPSFNPWTISGLANKEVLVSAVLASFLSPYQSGPGGRRLLRKLLQQTKFVASQAPEFDIEENYVVSTERYFPGDRSTRMDIVVEGSSFLLTIEVKIHAPEGKGIDCDSESIRALPQFERILRLTKTLAKERKKDWAVIVLSPSRPSRLTGSGFLTWTGVERAIHNLMPNNRNNYTFHDYLLHEFAQHITRF